MIVIVLTGYSDSESGQDRDQWGIYLLAFLVVLLLLAPKDTGTGQGKIPSHYTVGILRTHLLSGKNNEDIFFLQIIKKNTFGIVS